MFFYLLRTQKRKSSRGRKKTDDVILIEYTDIVSSIVCTARLVKALNKKYDYPDVIAFTFDRSIRSKWEKILIYWAMGIKLVLLNELEFKEKSETKTHELLSKCPTKDELINLEINGEWIGDLIYDEYLKRNEVATVDVEDPRFHETLKTGLMRYFLFEKIFDERTIRAISNGHQCYFEGIPLRIAANRDVEVFGCNESVVQRFSKNRLWGTMDVFLYREIFSTLPVKVQMEGREWAKGRIARRFSGEIGVDMEYSTRSAFSTPRTERPVILSSNKIKVLIAAHHVFDAANGFGQNLFPDFSVWMKCLCEISEKTDYDWYVKTHPDYLPGNNELVKEIISDYPRIKWIPNSTSHLQIVSEGIDFVLTVYGTPAFEYAALGVTVINASVTNPHIGYDFNIHPKSRDEYIEKIYNLSEECKLDICIEDVYEWYFMRHSYFNTRTWLLPDLQRFFVSGEKVIGILHKRKFYQLYLRMLKADRERVGRVDRGFEAFIMSDKGVMVRPDFEKI